GYNNRAPREFLETCEGAAKRAHHAQNNFYETFPAFAVGVIAAHQLNAVTTTIDQLAITFVIARILYAIFYIIDNHVLRTISWMAAFASIIGLFLIGIH
ncbi:MAG: MAPEG family protein, partial [Saprospiraceae bacterium]|nr:MAPEG family protein [Saprospiraceae bacterium]